MIVFLLIINCLCIKQYDLWNGMALVGGLFSHSQLLHKHECFVVFEAIKKSIENHSSIHMKNVLQAASHSLRFQFEERIRKVGYALIDLQRVSNLSNPQMSSERNVNL